MMHNRSLRQTAVTVWHQQRVKRLVRDRLGQGASCLVSVREIYCDDPECEGPATDIRIVTLDFRETRALVHRPLSEVTAADIARAL